MKPLILAAALIAASPALAQEPSTAPTVETETYGVRSEKTGEMTSVKVIRRYPPPPPEVRVYVLPPPVVYHRPYYGGYYRGRGW